MIQRHRDWRARLNAFLAANESRPHEWGTWDCMIGLAAGALTAIDAEGRDWARGYRGKYRGQVGAYRTLQRVDGVATPEALLTKLFGDPKPVAFARTGDLVAYEGCIGVMYGAEGIFIGCEMLGGEYAREGLVRIPRRELEACWHG